MPIESRQVPDSDIQYTAIIERFQNVEEASTACGELDPPGELASFNVEEGVVIGFLFNEQVADNAEGIQRFWIGMQREENSSPEASSFRFLDGRLNIFIFDGFPPWDGDQPDNAAGDEFCVAFEVRDIDGNDFSLIEDFACETPDIGALCRVQIVEIDEDADENQFDERYFVASGIFMIVTVTLLMILLRELAKTRRIREEILFVDAEVNVSPKNTMKNRK